MTQKHTPGPWHRNIHPRYPIYSGQRNQKVAAALYGERTGVSEAEALANCDLIAAAPELLAEAEANAAFLEQLAAHLEAADMPGQAGNCTIRAKATRAAISKAEGR